jgi:TolB-like protein/Flp pilus assembly protein TadD
MSNLGEKPGPPAAEPSGALSTGAILAHLETVLRSETLRRSDRLRRLLRYIVEQTVRGPGVRVDERSILAEVFDRTDSSTAGNPLVRVEAHRLRSKLAEYYATEGRQDRIEIALVHRGYRAVFRDRSPHMRWAQYEGAVRSVLVLRFGNLEGGAKSSVFVSGFMTELMYALTRIRDLRIVAENAWSAERVRDALARSDIDAVLEGNVRHHGRNLRLNAQLTSAADGTVLWAQMFERSSTDPAVQRQLADSISHSVGSIVGVGRKPGTSTGATGSKADLLYLRGCYHRDQQNPEALKKSVRCFEQAAALAPDDSQPYAGLAEAYTLLALCGEYPVPEVMPQVRAAAMRSLDIDAGAPDGHVGAGMAAALLNWDLNRAETEFQLAIETDPDNARARRFYACFCLLPEARFDEAVTQMRRAVELSPLSPITLNALGWALYFGGCADEALEQLQQATDLEPNFYLTHWTLGLLYEHCGRSELSIASFHKARALCGTAPSVLGGLGHAYAVFGMKQKAEMALQELRHLAADRYVPALDVACVCAGLGEAAAALEWLEKAADERCAWMLWLGVDPRLRTLHREPRFLDLLRRIGLSLPIR